MQTRLSTVLSTICGLIILSACTTVDNKNTTVMFPGGGKFTLMPVETLSRSLVATQRVQGHFDDRDFVMLAQLEIDNNHLAMVATTSTGATLFSLQYSDAGIDVERSSWLPGQLQPAYMLADLQMIFWPLPPLQQQLAQTGLDIVESLREGKRIRRIRRGEKTVINIHYDSSDAWQGTVRFENKRWQYSYTIETMQVE